MHRELLSLASEAAQLLGKTLFDLRDYTLALSYYTFAIKAALEAQHYDLWAVALGRTSLLLISTTQPQQALSCLQEIRSTSIQSQKIRSWCAAIEAEAYSYLHNSSSCLDALERAKDTKAVTQGRIHEKDVNGAKEKWDVGLGASYICEKAVQLGVPRQDILVENESLHTRENAEYVLEILKEHHLQRVILVTSPFHQLRTYLTFAKVFQPYGIEIINYYGNADDWNPVTWFLSQEHRQLVKSETERIKIYRKKGDLL